MVRICVGINHLVYTADRGRVSSAVWFRFLFGFFSLRLCRNFKTRIRHTNVFVCVPMSAHVLHKQTKSNGDDVWCHHVPPTIARAHTHRRRHGPKILWTASTHSPRSAYVNHSISFAMQSIQMKKKYCWHIKSKLFLMWREIGARIGDRLPPPFTFTCMRACRGSACVHAISLRANHQTTTH